MTHTARYYLCAVGWLLVVTGCNDNGGETNNNGNIGTDSDTLRGSDDGGVDAQSEREGLFGE